MDEEVVGSGRIRTVIKICGSTSAGITQHSIVL